MMRATVNASSLEYCIFMAAYQEFRHWCVKLFGRKITSFMFVFDSKRIVSYLNLQENMKIEAPSKCGEIWRHGPALFTFTCIQCGQLFYSTKEIFDHIESHLRRETEFAKDLDLGIECIPELRDDVHEVNELIIKEEEQRIDRGEFDRNCEAIDFETSLASVKETSQTANKAKKKKQTTSPNKVKPFSSDESKVVSCFRIKKNEPVECDFCGKIMKRQNIRDHLNTHSKTLKFPCTICKRKLRTKAALSCHLRNYHFETAKISEKDAGSPFGKPYDVLVNKNEIVECDFCGKKMKKRNIRDHLDIHASEQKFSCSICNKKIQTRPSLKSHEKTHRKKLKTDKDDKKFSCDICGWMFRDRCNLMVHIRRHKGEKPYKCKVCGKAFSQSSYINIHMRSHTGETPYKCTICNASFKGNSALHFHIRIKHTKTRPFKCGTCDRTFAHSRSLREHKRTHTGERPYICTVCNSNFSRRNAYEQHILLHTGIKSYKCKYCDMSFSQFAGRASHVKSAHKSVDNSVFPFESF